LAGSDQFAPETGIGKVFRSKNKLFRSKKLTVLGC
jgi:hypothetical protein